jgi:hypothetical protein
MKINTVLIGIHILMLPEIWSYFFYVELESSRNTVLS